MKTVILTFISLLILPNLLFATGDQRGNGGNVIVCRSGGKTTYELLDLYEGRTTAGFTYVPASGNDFSEILLQRIKSLERWNPKRADLYRAYFKTFEKEVLFIPEGQFAPVGDTGPAFYPKECDLRQVVVQWDIPTPTGYRYYINKDLWDPMPADQKAALLLHEFIYREGRLPQNDFSNSLGVRYFTAYVHSDLIGSSTLRSYLDKLRYVGFQEAEAQGVSIWFYTWDETHTVKKESEISFYTDYSVSKAQLADHFPVPGLPLLNGEFVCENRVEGEHSIAFGENGNIQFLHIGCGEVFYQFITDLGTGYVLGNEVVYDEQGDIRLVKASSNPRKITKPFFKYIIGHRIMQTMFFEKGDFVTVEFFNGTNRPKYFNMSSISTFVDTSLEIKALPIEFDFKGAVVGQGVQHKFIF